MMSVVAAAAALVSVVAASDIVFSNCVIDMIVRSSAGFIYIGWTF